VVLDHAGDVHPVDVIGAKDDHHVRIGLLDQMASVVTASTVIAYSLYTFTAEHIRTFEEDMLTLRMETPEIVPRATDHIPEMVGVIERLMQRGHTSPSGGSIYFRIASFPSYAGSSRRLQDSSSGVIGILSASVVQKMNLTCSGGSSSVFKSALKAGVVSMWTSSMM